MNARYFKHGPTGDMWRTNPDGSVEFKTQDPSDSYDPSSWDERWIHQEVATGYIYETDEHGNPLQP